MEWGMGGKSSCVGREENEREGMRGWEWEGGQWEFGEAEESGRDGGWAHSDGGSQNKVNYGWGWGAGERWIPVWYLCNCILAWSTSWAATLLTFIVIFNHLL